ncbi:tRNA pseudouridine(13) synthase TruD [Alteromonas sediminis]|uniref:tRNA pseudouridine synthase D n=1 Tax=Alteromonas sediminis TaxID=2259342 RepID=A0A3N5XY35_9ALTE|nr:tRNA pseudouridine(13) synthase TruD [Alteromonas sediminis]RPJ66047.1 tRNA pseudouridine(13) synthase TruD [Alteromonas sediminis]
MTFSEWQHNLGRPVASGLLKQYIEDFVVTEDLGYAPSGDGEHVFLWVEKQGQNTAFVAEQLAKQTGLPLRNVTYAGRKDKFALTRQWFGLHAPKGIAMSPETLRIEGVTVLSHTRHHKKLRVGGLKGNHFSLTLRGIDDIDATIARLETVKHQGVPNYFGDQRFGVRRNDDGTVSMGGTLTLAMRMVEGEVIRNRNKRNMAISALRSALFNTLVSERIQAGMFDQVYLGDACSLQGSNSFFIATEDTLSDSNSRYIAKDLSPSAPLVGEGENPTKEMVGEWESSIIERYQRLADSLKAAGVKTLRRAIKVWPENLTWQRDNDTLIVGFGLPSGCFATSVLRECINLNETQESGNE